MDVFLEMHCALLKIQSGAVVPFYLAVLRPCLQQKDTKFQAESYVSQVSI